MPSPRDEIFTEISKDFNIWWNFPNSIERIDASTSKSIARRTPAANILTTNSTIPVLQAVVDANLKFVTVDVAACGKQSDGGVF
jgi:hypothetical protein